MSFRSNEIFEDIFGSLSQLKCCGLCHSYLFRFEEGCLCLCCVYVSRNFFNSSSSVVCTCTDMYSANKRSFFSARIVFSVVFCFLTSVRGEASDDTDSFVRVAVDWD